MAGLGVGAGGGGQLWGGAGARVGGASAGPTLSPGGGRVTFLTIVKIVICLFEKTPQTFKAVHEHA